MASSEHRAQWLPQAGWGVFTHYLTSPETTSDQWNAMVDGFDVEGLARQLQRTGARYYCITIGQNSGHYCAPNATYDGFVGTRPSKCARRDLVADLSAALRPTGTRLLVYLPSGAPAADAAACARMDWRWGFHRPWPSGGGGRTGERLAAFQVRWETVIREWSDRWGDRVSGWWFDGCYFVEEMYRHPDPPNFASFAAAARSGNPQAIVAFNPGVFVPVRPHSEHEDYTAGEIAEAFPVCPGARVGNAQYHVLSYLGERWGGGEPRFSTEFVIGYTRDTARKGGAVTWDVPISPDGRLPEAFLQQLEAIGPLGPR